MAERDPFPITRRDGWPKLSFTIRGVSPPDNAATAVIVRVSGTWCSLERAFMKLIVWLVRAFVFVLLLVLALANTQNATLNFLAGYAWQAPLILIGLAFFGVGLLAGLVSAFPGLVRLKLENGRLKRDLRVAREAPPVASEPPLPPVV
jgi:uncharacterized integral membrane protein